MNKLRNLLPIALVLFAATPALAANNAGANAQAGQQNQQQLSSPSPAGNQVQNQNQIQTQNQGEDSQLQVQNQQQQNAQQGPGSGIQNQNQNATQNMSEVAVQVQQLLQIKTANQFGQQVKQVAQAQNQAQTQIQTQLNKLDSKGKVARFLTGTDINAVNNLKQQQTQNQQRIQQLSQLQTKLSNQGDTKMVQAAVAAMNRLYAALQQRIMAEEQTKSMFGWLFRMMSN